MGRVRLRNRRGFHPKIVAVVGVVIAMVAGSAWVYYGREMTRRPQEGANVPMQASDAHQSSSQVRESSPIQSRSARPTAGGGSSRSQRSSADRSDTGGEATDKPESPLDSSGYRSRGSPEIYYSEAVRLAKEKDWHAGTRAILRAYELAHQQEFPGYDVWVYKCQPEDNRSVAKIAKRFNASAEDIKRASNIGASDYIETSRLLVVPRAPHEHPLGFPTEGYISSGFGYRVHPISGKRRLHTGIDIETLLGVRALAAMDGVVTHAGAAGGRGNMVTLDHGSGWQTRYCHASEILVQVGQVVRQGEPVIVTGNTGYSLTNHLHFELLIDGDPVDPVPYL